MLPNSLKLNSEATLHTSAAPGAEKPLCNFVTIQNTSTFTWLLFFFHADNKFLVRKMERTGSSRIINNWNYNDPYYTDEACCCTS